ncbi:PREDICTED: LOW QUALITY PROTEIN: rRNA methyltransferase 1, mitochondrial-like [Lupinus angustifolius]|uniref:LOW QUALITY PROTEIN: rRNA methyltransferase 1, mitochondrial-like n=1 Tax=Lupinus angustifolius TaxID=3871 RepID=UPI00092F2C01|nr:PREDICTED: LOW QUALITY PROTEIN: rRNA methyltransferase 1, mitochondrial-like [Lupinus angustifolius]
MYSNISKVHAFPLASKISSQPRCYNSPLALKFQSLPFAFHQKPSQNPEFKNPSHRHGSLCLMNPVNPLAQLQHGALEMGKMLKVGRRYCRGSNNRKKKDKKGFEKVLKIAEKFGLSVKEAPKHDLNMVVDNRPHQGLVLDASPLPLEMVKIMELDPVSIDEGKGSFWVALDEVTDPQNMGAIIRSAYYFGVSGIVLCVKNSARLSGVVSKASAGSLELMELRYCKNMMQFLVSSAENGWRVLGGSVSSKAVSLDEVVPGAPTILVLGSEGTGLRPLVERSCTQLVRIPGNTPSDVNTSEFNGESISSDCESSGKEFLSFLAVESLNVSVAAGVLIHHLIGTNSAESLPEGYR